MFYQPISINIYTCFIFTTSCRHSTTKTLFDADSRFKFNNVTVGTLFHYSIEVTKRSIEICVWLVIFVECNNLSDILSGKRVISIICIIPKFSMVFHSYRQLRGHIFNKKIDQEILKTISIYY